MNDIIQSNNITQADICAAQDAIHNGALERVEVAYEHYFADGVYARVMKCPAGALVIGKPHRTEHISILLKGSCTITDDDGTSKYVEAPMIVVSQAGRKKMALVHTDMEFVNIHPTETTNLDEIEKKVIIPEEEFRTMLIKSELKTAELLKDASIKENGNVLG